MRKIIFVSIAISIMACNPFSDSNWIVKYKDHALYKNDISGILPAEYTPEDSIQIINEYIDNWLKNKIMLEESASILPDSTLLDIEDKIALYRNDLVSNAVEENWLLENPDYEVNEEEIASYYKKQKPSFTLKEDIVNYSFINVPQDSASYAKKLIQKNDSVSLATLQQWADKNQYTAQLNKNYWEPQKKVQNLIEQYQETGNATRITGKRLISFEKDGLIFILNISDYKRKGSTSPYEFVKNDIKNILINKRKLNLLSRKKEDLYQKAVYENEIKRK